MKPLLENWRKYLKETSKDKPVAIKDVHELADALNIPWDDDAEFMRWTEKLTGESHLDKMTGEELSVVYTALNYLNQEETKNESTITQIS